MKDDKELKKEYLALKAENDAAEAGLLEKHGQIIPPRPTITLECFQTEPEGKDR